MFARGNVAAFSFITTSESNTSSILNKCDSRFFISAGKRKPFLIDPRRLRSEDHFVKPYPKQTSDGTVLRPGQAKSDPYGRTGEAEVCRKYVLKRTVKTPPISLRKQFLHFYCAVI